MITKEFSSFSMKIPRKITGSSNAIYQIVGFSDASQLHFTANIYLRTIENNKASMKLIFAKLRTKKNFSIPRMELLGSALCCKSLNFVMKQLQINVSRVLVFNDSKACILPYCYDKSNPDTKEIFELPSQALIYKQKIEIKFIMDSKENLLHLECPAVEYCQIQQCYICLERLFWIYRCYNSYIGFIAVTMTCIAYMVVSVLYAVFNCIIGTCKYSVDFLILFKWIFAMILKLIKFLLQPLHIIYNKCFSKPNKKRKKRRQTREDEVELLEGGHRELPLKYSMTSAIAISLLPSACAAIIMIGICCCTKVAEAREPRDCAEVITITAHSNLCTRFGDGRLSCIIEETTLASIKPHRQTTCLFIKDPKGHPIGTMKLTFGEVIFLCKKVYHHFTKPFKIADVSSRRCPTEGSCRGDRCLKIQPQETIDEFNGLPNERFGYTFCMTGGNGWLGIGCGFPTDACEFWRLYAIEEPESSYENYGIFGCMWEQRIPIEGVLFLNNVNGSLSKKTFKLEITPDEPSTWEDVKIKLMAEVRPPSKYFNAYFLENGTHHALLNEEQFEESKAFMCNEAASPFRKCRFRPESCSCWPAEGQMKCNCKKFTMREIMEKHHFPTITPLVTFKSSNKEIEAHFSEQTSIAVLIQFNEKTIETIIDEVTVLKFSFKNPVYGCAGCEIGAPVEYVCSTNGPTTEVHVSCPKANVHFSATCYERERNFIKYLAFNDAKIAETCSIVWRGGRMESLLETDLAYMVPLNPQLSAYEHQPLMLPYGIGLDLLQQIFSKLLDWILSSWWHIFYVVLGGVAAIMIPTTIWCPLIWCCLCHGPNRHYHTD